MPKKNKSPQLADQQLIRRIAWLLDSSIRIPGTNFRIGLDAIIGLIPWAGDVAGSVLSFSIPVLALRVGASRWTLLRMSYNILVETVIGSIPIFGDIFDAVWKANDRNVALLERSTLDLRAKRKDFWFMTALALGLLTALGLSLWGSYVLTVWAFHTISQWFQN